jgi:hypothetical protein
MATINPELLVSGKEEETLTKLQKIKTLVEANPAPMTIRGKTMAPHDPDSEVPFHQALAGGHVKDSATGKTLLTHEYNHKSMQNLAYAVC